MSITLQIHRNKDSVAGASAEGKQLPIPQSMLKLLEKTPSPVEKPVVVPKPKVKRMPKDQLRQLRACLVSRERKQFETTMAFIKENKRKFHIMDRLAIDRYLTVSRHPLATIAASILCVMLAFGFSGIVRQRHAQSIIANAAKAETVYLQKPAVRRMGAKDLKTLQGDVISFNPYLASVVISKTSLDASRLSSQDLYGIVGAALNSRYVRVQKAAIPLIAQLPGEYQIACIKTAFKIRDADVQVDVFSLIRQLSPKIKADCIKAAMGNEYDYVAFAAFGLITSLPPNYQSDCIDTALKSGHADLYLEAASLLKTIKDETARIDSSKVSKRGIKAK